MSIAIEEVSIILNTNSQDLLEKFLQMIILQGLI